MRTPKPRNRRSSSDLQSVQVFCRLKPRRSNTPSCLEIINDRTIKSTGSRTGAQKQTLHTFTAVFGEEIGQEEIFQNVALPLVSDLLEGKNGLLLTYGVTGSGKTFALQGNKKEGGILPLTLDVIFNSISDKQTKKYVVKPDGLNGFDLQSESDAIMDRHRLDYQQRLRLPRSDLHSNTVTTRPCLATSIPVASKALYAVFISLVEVYNNNVYDLLQEVPDAPGRIQTSHALREDAQRNIYVSGSIEVEVKTADDALRVFTTGLKRRRVGQTALNNESSRSHCIFTIRLVRTGYDEKYDEAIEDKNLLVVSQLCLVDLAGSERANRAGTKGDRLKEASSINNSLMNLRKCIEMLREIQHTGQWAPGLATPGGTNRIVPYRDNRLTHLFKNFFEGHGRVVLLVCVHQSVEDYDETMHVLKFAESTQEVSTFRTPVIPPPSPAPMSQRRRYANGFQDSGRSTGTTNTTVSLPMVDDQTSLLLAELDDFDVQVDRCLSRLLSCTEQAQNMDPTDSSSDATDDQIHWTDEVEQDSAPENDRAPREQTMRQCRLRSFPNNTYKVDTEPLRALITQRMDARQRSYVAFEHDMSAFRSCLIDSMNMDLSTLPNVTDQHEKARLETRIHQLEGQVVESIATMKQERAERLRQTEESRMEIDRLRTIIDLLNDNVQPSLTTDSKRTKRKSSRPSAGNANLVSILSRQWENRLAEQKRGNKQQPNTTRNNPNALVPSASTNKIPQRRVVAFNPRYRRSRSVGGDAGRWLEHQETTPVPLGTVFTPNLKRRKSVSQVELKDTLEATNYILHHQEADSDGNVETQLFKGSIIPTAGGGSAVIFDDVEKLKQSSPCKKERKSYTPKRKSSQMPLSGSDSRSSNEQSPIEKKGRKSMKRHRSPSAPTRNSASSTSTQSSQGSAQTTSSSNYQPFGPPLPPPLMPNHMGHEVLRDRCQLGISSTGGIAGGRTLRKRSRV